MEGASATRLQQHMTTSRVRAAVPRLADGVEFLGEYQDSGYSQAPMLVRRADGQVLLLSSLLYTLAGSVDGKTRVEDLAEQVSARAARRLTAEGVAYLLEEKLRPMGLLASDDGPREPPRARPLLAIRARRGFIREPTVNRLAAGLQHLFRAPAVAVLLVGLALVDYAVLIREGIGHSLQAMAMTPAFVLAVLALILVSILFHEFGHAAGCRSGGGRPGGIGIGIYLVWPVFYTNVNDAYRLSKAGRLRTDLGGGYFSVISVVVWGAAYAVSSWPPFAIATAAIQLQIVPQLLPIVRFDGYYALSDLVGVPDLSSRVGPILRNLFRRRPEDPRVRDLRPRIRVVVTVWVLTVIPLLAASFGLLLVHLPTYLRESWATLQARITASVHAIGNADVVGVALGAVEVLAVLIPVAGIMLIVARLGRTILRGLRARRGPLAAGPQPQQVGLPGSDALRPGAATVMREQTNGDVERPAARPSSATAVIRRTDVYPRPVVDGGELRDNALTRLRHFARQRLRSAGEREELFLDSRLARLPGVTRSNTVAVISPKGGVGKTTSTFLIGNALADYLNLHAVAVDANPDFGTLGNFAPDRARVDPTLADLLANVDRLEASAQLRPYVSKLPSGLHLLAAPADADAMADMTPARYGQLLAFLGRFYDLVLLDCGTGVTDALAQFAIRRSDQTVIVATPEWITASQVLGALHHLPLERATLVLNQAPARRRMGQEAIEAQFRKEQVAKRVTIPYDDELRTMLDAGTYSLDRLDRPLRLAVKRLALAVGEQLV